MRYSTSTTDPLVTACQLHRLADYMVADQDDPAIDIVARQATAAVVEFLECDLVSRNRVTVYQHWPHIGTYSGPSLSPQDARLSHEIVLPFANLEPDTSPTVTVFGEAFSDFEVLEANPASVRIRPQHSTSDDPAIRIEYVSGFGPDVLDVPEHIRDGVIMLAAFMFEHRGECDAQEALRRSGAASYLQPYSLRSLI